MPLCSIFSPNISFAVCSVEKPTTRHSLSIRKSSFSSGSPAQAFLIICDSRDISFRVSSSSLMCLPCTFTNSLLYCSRCFCIIICSLSMLSSRATTSSRSCWFSCFSSLISPLPKREPTFAIMAVLASVLTTSSRSVPISLLICSSRFSAAFFSDWSCCTSVSSSPVCRFKSR